MDDSRVIGTVVIVTYNSETSIRGCLEPLQKGMDSGWLKVVVVDNCSTDKTVQLIRIEFPLVVIHQSLYNGGFGYGNNIGISLSEGWFCLILNPDAVIELEDIRLLANQLKLLPDAGCIAPVVIGESGKIEMSYFPFHGFWVSILVATGLSRLIPINRIDKKWVVTGTPSDKMVEVDRVLGAVMMLKLAEIKRIGGFDERFFLYSEEEDICLRLLSSGYRTIYLPSAKSHHQGAVSTGKENPVTIAAVNWSRDLYMRLHCSTFVAILSRITWVVALSLRMAVSALVGKRKRAEGYLYSIKSLIDPTYFDRVLRPKRVGEKQ